MRNWGYAALWWLVAIASIVAGVTSIDFTRDRPAEPAAVATFFLSTTVAALGLLVQARHDRYAFAMFSTVLAFVTGLFTGAVALLGEDPHPVAAAVALLALAALFGSVRYLVRSQFGREVLPNVLRERYDRALIHEVDGVQFVAEYGPHEPMAGAAVGIRVVVQNCWDAKRTLVFGLKTETRIALDRAGLHYAPEPRVEVPGASVVALTIPVLVHPRAKGRFTLLVSPRVEGTGGTRVRSWRGKAIGTRIPWWLTAIGPLFGFLVWGGGIKLRIRVQQHPQPFDLQLVAPEPSTQLVWAPEEELLRATVRAAA